MATTEELLFILRMQDRASSVLLGFAGTIAATTEVLKSTVGVFREYELGVANIQKVTGISGTEVKGFSEKFDNLARTIPVTVKALQEIAYSAGSLGVSGTADVLAITEAMAKLGTTTNVTGDKGTIAMAQLLNIMHEGIGDNVARLGSQLVALDNISASSGMTILQLGKEVGLATNFFHLGSGEALAWGAALAAAGIRAERGGTAVGRVFTALDQATRGSLPAGLKDLEKIFDKTSEQLRFMQLADPGAFAAAFVGKLGEVQRAGGNYYALLKDLGLGQRETASSILPLAANFETLQKNLLAVAVEAKYTTATNREFAIFMETLDSKIKVAANALTIFEKDLGAAMGGPSKSAVDLFAGAINALDSAFKSLTPQQQLFIVSEVTLVASILGVVSVVRALVVAFQLLGLAVLANPFVLAGTAVAALVVGIVTLNSTVREHIELSQTEVTRLAQLTSGTDDATYAMNNLTKAQAANIQLALTQKIEETRQKMEELIPQLRTGQSTVEFFAKAFLGLGSSGTASLERLYDAYDKGQISVKEYLDILREIAANADSPALRAQATRILNLKLQWDAAGLSLQSYNALLKQLQEHGEFPDAIAKPKEVFGPPEAPPTFGTPKKTGTNNAQQIEDFERETALKIAGFGRETAALKISTQAYQEQQRVERENAEVEGIFKRGSDLKIKTINDTTAAYRTALEQRDNTRDATAAKDEFKDVTDKIDAFHKEDEAFRAGTAAYAAYKLAAKIDPEIDVLSKKLLALGMEKDKVDELAAAYRAAGMEHAETAIQAEKDNIKQKESADLAKGIATSFTTAAEGIALEGKSFGEVADSFAKAVEKMVIQALILKPIQAELSGLFDSGTTPGSTSKSNALGGGGVASGGILGMIGSLFGKGGKSGGGGASAEATNSALDNLGGGVDGPATAEQVASAAGSSGWMATAGSWLAKLFHEGGVVGEGSMSRVVNSAMFANAPRYHTGLGNDEFAAILQRGERVLTDRQNQRMTATVQGLSEQMNAAGKTQGAGHTINFNISTPDADSFKSSQSQLYSKAQVSLAAASSRTR
jgi:TP901 family phage tail tape measure protein